MGRQTCLALRPLWRVSLPFGSMKASSATMSVEEVFSTSASFCSGAAIGGDGEGDGGSGGHMGRRFYGRRLDGMNGEKLMRDQWLGTGRVRRPHSLPSRLLCANPGTPSADGCWPPEHPRARPLESAFPV